MEIMGPGNIFAPFLDIMIEQYSQFTGQRAVLLLVEHPMIVSGSLVRNTITEHWKGVVSKSYRVGMGVD